MRLSITGSLPPSDHHRSPTPGGSRARDRPQASSGTTLEMSPHRRRRHGHVALFRTDSGERSQLPEEFGLPRAPRTRPVRPRRRGFSSCSCSLRDRAHKQRRRDALPATQSHPVRVVAHASPPSSKLPRSSQSLPCPSAPSASPEPTRGRNRSVSPDTRLAFLHCRAVLRRSHVDTAVPPCLRRTFRDHNTC